MKQIDIATQHLKQIFEPIVGEIHVKTYFAYYGVFKSNIMFGIYRDGDFFLRATERTLQQILSVEDTYNFGDRQILTKKHYYIPPHLFHTSEFSALTKLVVEDLLLAAEKNLSEQKNYPRNLSNLNMNVERLLNRQGIRTVEELRAVGEVAVFVRMIETGEDVGLSLLFRLYGALHSKHIDLISPKEKMKLVAEVDDALYAKGLRRRFQAEYERLKDIL